jgi:hypothetical protein
MPLSWTRKTDAWDASANGVLFPAEDSDSLAPIGCTVSEEALVAYFGGERGEVPSLLGAFRRYRLLIERVASDKYDAGGRPAHIALAARDFAADHSEALYPHLVAVIPARKARTS